MHSSPAAHRRGFTLVELMLVLVVAGILAAVAYPAFTSYVQRSRRADATAVLSAIMQAQERFRSNNGAYASDLGSTGLDIDVSKLTKHYDVSITGVGEVPSLVSGYVLTATAKTTSPQHGDVECNKLVIKLQSAMLDYSAKNRSGGASTSCWPR